MWKVYITDSFKAIIYEKEDLGRSDRLIFTLQAVNVKTVNEDYLGISDNFLNNILLFLNLEVLW